MIPRRGALSGHGEVSRAPFYRERNEARFPRERNHGDFSRTSMNSYRGRLARAGGCQ